MKSSGTVDYDTGIQPRWFPHYELFPEVSRSEHTPKSEWNKVQGIEWIAKIKRMSL
jgi:hypothetical protein